MLSVGDVVKADVGSPAFRTLASVMAPGVLLLGELYAFAEDVDSIKTAVRHLPREGFALAAVVLVGFLVVAFAVGFVGRRLAFNLLDPPGRETIPDVRSCLARELGDDLWVLAFARHEHVLDSLEKASGSGFWLFLYCKDWLKRHCLGMAGLERETEVNVFAGLLWPTLLAPLAVVGLLDLRGAAALTGTAVGVVLGLALAAVDAWFVRRMFKADIRDGIRTFVLVNAQPADPAPAGPPVTIRA